MRKYFNKVLMEVLIIPVWLGSFFYVPDSHDFMFFSFFAGQFTDDKDPALPVYGGSGWLRGGSETGIPVMLISYESFIKVADSRGAGDVPDESGSVTIYYAEEGPEEPSITVWTEIPDGEVEDGRFEITYTAAPGRGAAIEKIYYVINGDVERRLYTYGDPDIKLSEGIV